LTLAAVPELRDHTAKRVDIVGFATVALGFVLVVMASSSSIVSVRDHRLW